EPHVPFQAMLISNNITKSQPHSKRQHTKWSEKIFFALRRRQSKDYKAKKQFLLYLT
ncbi:hypothetical protein L9F63_009860, partial [Diploptera punctata]